MKKVLKYIYRTLLMLMAMIIVLIAITAGVIQTALFKRKVAAIIEEQGSEYVNGELAVGSIEGNFFSAIALKELLVTDNADTIIYIEEIGAEYNLWPLLRRNMSILSVTITKPSLFVKQLNDSTWNLQNIFILPDNAQQDTTKNSSFQIDVAKFMLTDGSIKIESPDSIIPQQIENINADLSLSYSENRQLIAISDFTLNAKSPDLFLHQLSFDLIRESQTIEIKDLFLKTALNQVEAEGRFSPEPLPSGYIRLTSSPVMLREFEFLLPGIQPRVSPLLDLDARVRNDSLLARFRLEEVNEDIFIDLTLGNLRSLISGRTDSAIRYIVTGELNQITLADWSGIQNLNYILTGNILAEGVGINPETAVAQLKGDFRKSVVEQWPVDRLDFKLEIDKGDLSGYAIGSGNFGVLELYPDIRGFMGERPFYNLRLLTRQLNLSELTGVDTLQSDIYLEADISGSGFDLERINAHATIFVSSSGIFGIRIDSLLAEAAYSDNNLRVDSLILLTNTIEAIAYGNYSLNSVSDLAFLADIKSLEEIKQFVPLKDAQAYGRIEAHLRGRADSMNIHAIMALGEIEYDSIYSDTISLNADLLITEKDTLADATLLINNIWSKSFQLDSVNAKLSATPDSAYGVLRFSNHELSTGISAGVHYGENLMVRLDDLGIKYKDQQWALALKQHPAIFEMDSGAYRLSNFEIVQNNTDSIARITANGTFSMVGTEDFQIELINIDIEETAKTFYGEIDASGKFNLVLKLQGSAVSPELKGDFSIENPIFNKHKISEFGGNMDYRDNLLNVSSRIVPQDSVRFEFSGEIPLALRLDSLSYQMNPAGSLHAKLAINRFPLAVLQVVGFTEEIKGYMEGGFKLDGTVENPNLEGDLRLQEAALKIPKYGIDYSKIDLRVGVLNNQISLDTLFVETSDGTMTGNGKIDFGSAIYKGDISNTDIKINFDRFNPVDHRQFNIEMSGDALLTGKRGDVVFDGDINIPESEIYLPFVMNMLGVFTAPEMPKPILLRELREAGKLQDSINTVIPGVIIERSDSSRSKYFENFTGKVNIKIPKNSWIKNEDFRIELSGDLELLKNKEYFEIFGTVDILRGQYDLFGRTFIIDKGTVTLQGGEEIKPDLNVTATYTFRNDQRVEQELTVNIAGSVSSPDISFTLDGNSISEGDALSYILFGRGLNELTMSQQENMSGSSGLDLAKTSASSLLASQITRFLGDKLNVDYIEVKGDGSFENARLSVGKYITNNLFVNYEQQFGENSHQDIDRYRVELEYELFKFLFIQLNNSSSDSGFNVIVKFNSK